MLRNIGANWVLTLLSIVSAYVLMPYTINALGKDGYGVWILITAVTGYLGLLVLGTPMTSVRFLAKSIAANDGEKVNQYVAGFAGLYLGLGAVCILIGAVLYLVMPHLFDIPVEYQDEARVAFVLVVFNTAAGFLQQLPYGIFSAHNDFVKKNLMMGSLILFRLLLTLLLLIWWPAVTTIALIQTISIAAEMCAAFVLLRKTYPEIALRVGRFQVGTLREVLSFTGYVIVLQIGMMLSYQTDALVIGGLLSVEKITDYTVANSLTVYYMQFIVAIASVVMPMSTTLQGKEDWDGLRRLFLKWSKISLGLTLVGGLYLLVLGPRFLAWWLGAEFEHSAGGVLVVLMASFILFLPVRGVAQPMLMGLGIPQRATRAFLLAGILNLVISLILAKPLGIMGVALGTAVPTVIYAMYVAHLGCKAVGVPMTEYLRYVYLRGAIISIPVLALLRLLLWRYDPRSFVALFLCGVCSASVFAVLWTVFVIRNDEYISMDGLLERVRRRGKST